MIKIAIACSTQGTLKTKTALSIIETIRLNKSIDFLPIFRFGGYIAENKAKEVEVAQNCLCSHIFFVDHDMKFDPNVVTKLLSYDKYIIGAMYNYRYLPIEPMVKFLKEDGDWTAKIEEAKIDKIPNKIFEVGATGGGMLLVKMSVFDKLKKPYFKMEQDGEGNRVVTEDSGFYLQAQKLGIKVWCDPSLGIKHLGDLEF